MGLRLLPVCIVLRPYCFIPINKAFNLQPRLHQTGRRFKNIRIINANFLFWILHHLTYHASLCRSVAVEIKSESARSAKYLDTRCTRAISDERTCSFNVYTVNAHFICVPIVLFVWLNLIPMFTGTAGNFLHEDKSFVACFSRVFPLDGLPRFAFHGRLAIIWGIIGAAASAILYSILDSLDSRGMINHACFRSRWQVLLKVSARGSGP
jgi:hypothetical protein